MRKKSSLINPQEVKARSLWQDAWRRLKKNKVAYIGFIFIIILVLVSIATLLIDLFTNHKVIFDYLFKSSYMPV